MHALLLLAAWTLSGGASPAPPSAASPLAASPLAPSSTSHAQDPDDEPQDTTLRVHGRLVDPEGAPVEGVELRLTGIPPRGVAAERFDPPEDWSDPEPVRTDADGRFELRFEPPPGYLFDLTTEDARIGAANWTWFGHEHRRELDLGTTVVGEPATLTGHALSPDGELLTRDVEVVLQESREPTGAVGPTLFRRWTRRAKVDPETGTFRIEGIPAGTIDVLVTDGHSGRFAQGTLELSFGEVRETSWTVEDRGETSRLTVMARSSRGPMVVLEPGSVVAVTGLGDRIEFPEPRTPGRPWVLDGLAPGTYAIEIVDPRFEPWRTEEARPGTTTLVSLVGTSALRVTVLDADGRPVERCAAILHTPGAFRPLVLNPIDRPWPEDGRFGELVAGDHELEIEPESGPSVRVAVVGLAAGEERAVTVRLGAPQGLVGRVVDASGAPLAGVEVQRTRGTVCGHDDPLGGVQSGYDTVDGEPVPFQIPPLDAVTRTDADGRFAFGGLSAGPQALRVDFGTWTRVDRVVEVLGDETTECVLTRPATGAVDVAVEVPDDIDPTRVQVRVEPEDPGGLLEMEVRRRAAMGGPARERAPGRVEGLPAGPVRVEVLLLPTADVGPRNDDPRRGIGPAKGTVVHEHVVEVAADRTTEVRVDLRERFPATGTVQVTFDGAPAEGARPVLVRRDAGEPARVSGTALDDEGAGTFAAVPPGTYDLRVDHRRAGWTWTAPEPVVVEARTPFALRLDVRVIARRLLLVDAAGTPLPNRTVQWRPATLPARGSGTTDATGHLDLRLPAGDYTLGVFPEGYDPSARRRTTPRPDPVEVPLTWTAGEGAVRVVVGG